MTTPQKYLPNPEYMQIYIFLERDKEEQCKLAAMGWHCITIWECELKPKVREQTLESLAFTLNHIWMKDHQVIAKPYPQFEEEEGMMKAAEE